MKDQFRFLLFVFLLVPFFDLQTPMHSIGERDTENKRKKQNGYHICAVRVCNKRFHATRTQFAVLLGEKIREHVLK